MFNTTLKTRIVGLEREKQALQDRLNEVEDSLKARNNEVRSLREVVRVFQEGDKKVREEHDTALEGLRQSMREKEDRLVKEAVRLKEKEEALRQKCQEDLSSAREELALSRETIADLEEDAIRLRGIIQTFEGKVTDLEGSLSSRVGELKTLKANFTAFREWLGDVMSKVNTDLDILCEDVNRE